MAVRILVVEDHPANLKLMVYLLKAYGHTPLVAHDGAEALELIRREPLDLIVCDVQLPRVDGYEIARQLKSDPALRAIPLVAVTALAMVGDRDKVLAAGFDGYISKPISPQTFVEQLQKFLSPEQQTSRPPVAPPTATAPSPTKKRATVLVVDNSPVNILLARKILEPSGYDVVAAGSVAEGLVLARQNRPDLILSDMHMPRADGHDFIKSVKADPTLRDIPFVFISATVWGDRDRDEGLALGASKFLLRPIDPSTLLAEIESCLPKEPRGQSWPKSS